MSNFNRERFLFWLLAAVLATNGLFFAYGLIACSRTQNPREICPNIGERFDTFSERTMAAVLGLIAGSAAVGGAAALTRRKIEGEEPANAKSITPNTTFGDDPAGKGSDGIASRRRRANDQKQNDG